MPPTQSAPAAAPDVLTDVENAAQVLAGAFTGSKPALASTTVQAGLLSTGAGVVALIVPMAEKALGLSSAEDLAIGGAIAGVAAIIAGVQTIIGRFKADTKLH